MTAKTYADMYRRSLEDPALFWAEHAALIDWVQAPSRVLDDTNAPLYKWYPDGVLNTCYNALDRHPPSRVALIYDSPVTGTIAHYTYGELTDLVSRFAGTLRSLGVGKGDRVVVYMPMVPEAVVAMLACARLGAVHSVVFGGFAAPELAIRIDDAKPVVIVSASCGLEGSRVIEYKPLLDRAVELASHKPAACVILQRPQAAAPMGTRDREWSYGDPVEAVPVSATDPLYILYTSGTTGGPKGVVRDNGGHAVAMCWSMRNIYGVSPGDVYWAASDVGWVVGHSYIVYGPLLHGCTTVLYEGKPVGTPDPGAFWRVISQHNVKTLFTAPTAFRAIRKEDPNASFLTKYDLSSFEALYLAGERLDPDTHTWATDVLQVPVIDHWWQTETGWSIAANPRGIELLPIKAGSPTKPAPGYDVRIMDPNAEGEGAICLKLPLPPGALSTLYNDDARYIRSYLATYQGYYLTGDGGYFDDDGYLYVMGRTDDVINVAGHRLSTGAMEAVLAQHPDVAECAVIGAHDDLKGQVPVGLVVLKSGSEAAHVESDIVAMMRDQIGAVASLRRVVVVGRLPKTRSGKILRAIMRAIADGRDYTIPSTIDDPAILAEVSAALASH